MRVSCHCSQQALAFPEGLLRLSPLGGLGELPFARVICFRGVLNCGCGLLIDVLNISVEVRVFGGSSVLSASADFGSFQRCGLVGNHAVYIRIVGVNVGEHVDLGIARLRRVKAWLFEVEMDLQCLQDQEIKVNVGF